MNPYFNSMAGFGGGFIAFWPSLGGIIIPDEVRRGGDSSKRKKDLDASLLKVLIREDEEIMAFIMALGRKR